jgi:hypothetical protein
MERIEDPRTIDQFKVTTFSKYKRTDVKKEWFDCMMKGQVEAVCHWSIELLCSGLLLDLWDLFFLFSFKYIRNPKVPLYLDMRYQQFKKEANVDELSLRNNEEIRKLFLEIVGVLCTSVRSHGYEIVKVTEVLPKSRLKAPTIEFNKAFRPNDPVELFIPLNEFSYMLSVKDSAGACFWVEWMFLLIQKHKIMIVREKKIDPIWLVWETIEGYAKDPLNEKVVQAIVSLFSVAYSPSLKEKRRFMIYYAISLCCETIPCTDLIKDKTILEKILSKSSLMFGKFQVKK